MESVKKEGDAVISIVPMQTRHVAEVARLERICFSAPWSADSLRRELDTPGAAFFVAENEAGVPVGYVGAHIVLDEGYIANLAVHPDYRRRGVASALLERLEALAAQRGLAFWSLEVRESNAAAIRLYTRHGYAVTGRRPGFYRAPPEDALLMTHRFE